MVTVALVLVVVVMIPLVRDTEQFITEEAVYGLKRTHVYKHRKIVINEKINKINECLSRDKQLDYQMLR